MAYNRPIVDRVPIFTIGYGAREIDAFIAALQQQRIEFVLDVRSRPYSRYKPDFSCLLYTSVAGDAGRSLGRSRLTGND